MKKIWILVFLSVMCLSLKAQSYADLEERDQYTQNNKYLTVKGLKLKPGLKMEDALNYFLSKGFKKRTTFENLKERDGYYALEGDFFNIASCHFDVTPTRNNPDVLGVVAIFLPERNSFRELISDYNNLKQALCLKYNLNSSKEYFTNQNIDKSGTDKLKLYALQNNDAVFESTFTLEADNLQMGFISLNIESVNSNGNRRSYVTLTYATPDQVLESRKNILDDI